MGSMTAFSRAFQLGRLCAWWFQEWTVMELPADLGCGEVCIGCVHVRSHINASMSLNWRSLLSCDAVCVCVCHYVPRRDKMIKMVNSAFQTCACSRAARLCNTHIYIIICSIYTFCKFCISCMQIWSCCSWTSMPGIVSDCPASSAWPCFRRFRWAKPLWKCCCIQRLGTSVASRKTILLLYLLLPDVAAIIVWVQPVLLFHFPLSPFNLLLSIW